MEIWKDIPGYEGLYQVSSLGRIKSLHNRVYNDIILIPSISRGYERVQLSKNKNKRMYSVHRLVATAFVDGNLSLQVNHKDGNKLNNYYLNLEWITCQENVQHAYDNGINSKVKKVKITKDKEVLYFNSTAEASRYIGVSRSGVCNAANPKHSTKTVKKWIAEYV